MALMCQVIRVHIINAQRLINFQAQECLVSAPNAAKSAEILIFLAKLCAQKNEIIPAIEAYKKALEVYFIVLLLSLKFLLKIELYAY